MRTTLNYLICLSCLLLPGWHGETVAHAGDDPPKVRLRSVSSGRAAGLAPISRGRAATLSPVTRGRAAKPAPVGRGRAAVLPGAGTGRSARLPAVTVNRPAKLPPVTRDRAATLEPVSSGREAGLAPITRDRAAGLSPVTRGRAARLAPVTRGRAAALPPRNSDPLAGLNETLLDADHPPVLSFDDGYVAPLGARSLVQSGSMRDALARVAEGRAGPDAGFLESRVGAVRVLTGRGADVLDRTGFQSGGDSRRDGDGLLAYYVRGREAGPGSGRMLLFVSGGHAEEVPGEFDRMLMDSVQPLELAKKALADGRYIQAALAFQEERNRSSRSIAAAFGLADAQLALGNLEPAADSIRAGLDLLPHWSDDIGARRIATGEGEAEKRIETVARYAKRKPASEKGMFLLGYMQLTSGNPGQVEMAGATLRAALDLDPDGRHTLRLIRFLQTR